MGNRLLDKIKESLCTIAIAVIYIPCCVLILGLFAVLIISPLKVFVIAPSEEHPWFYIIGIIADALILLYVLYRAIRFALFMIKEFIVYSKEKNLIQRVGNFLLGLLGLIIGGIVVSFLIWDTMKGCESHYGDDDWELYDGNRPDRF